ncbi:MAG: ATP-binding protein [Fusobacteriaceae bacterium]|jgi:hypothetical protein|nr:ATP-binding protein [Fusobacteriaceae bacterium]
MKEKTRRKPLPVGVSDFDTMIREGYYYVDKTNLIHDLLYRKAAVTLFTRPRRFGKTLNMSMLYYFFDIRNAEKNKELFHGLNIEKSEFYSEQGKYPVIFLSFADLKPENWENCYTDLKEMISELFTEYSFIKESIPKTERDRYERIENLAPMANYRTSLKFLSRLLKQYFKKKVAILIDEYDAPLVSAWNNGFYEKAIGFFRQFYTGALKDNKSLKFGVLTGILRVAKEGIFSGLNNPVVNTILDKNFDEYYGLTESEVMNAIKAYNLETYENQVREWYNGYRFGNIQVYNPWSVLNYLSTGVLEAYWVNSSSNDLINRILDTADHRTFQLLLDIFNGQKVKCYIDKNIAFDEIEWQENLVTLLFFSGYLTTEENLGNNFYLLRIPNKEVLSFFQKRFILKFLRREKNIGAMVSALEQKKITGEGSFEFYLQESILNTFSSFDLRSNEVIYHVFLLGIFENEPNYRIFSNLESGLGRADIILEPFDRRRPGFIFELKVADAPDQLDKKLDEALKQIEDKKYAAYLKKQGIKEITAVAVAFCGKELKVRAKTL